MVIMKNVQNDIERSIVVEPLYGTFGTGDVKDVYMVVCNYGFGQINVFPFADAEEAYDTYLRMTGRKGR